MSTLPDSDFDLEKLFLPAWAQEESSSAKYAQYEGEKERPDRRGDRRGPRPLGREGFGGRRREGGAPRGERRGPAPRDGGGAPRGAARPAGGPRHGGRRGERPERREPPPPLPEVDISLVPEEKGVESLARQIKMTGRAFPLFDIAQMILQKPERHCVAFSVKKNAEAQPVQPLFVCALDDSLWLSESEAISHVLRKHFATFYQAEKTATEPPKGKYTFVAQCGLSGAVLGPPNHHDYQNQLRKLHAERFSRMPFEVYKAKVRIVRDEAVVNKWVEDQSWKTEYICLNMPEPMRLANMEAVEKHFREHHKENIIKPVESHTLSGVAARGLRSHELTRLVRSAWEDQRRFPLQIATVLSQQFASHGLQFFKVNKTITHVSVARPHYLDLSVTPVSEGVKRIVDFVNATPKCTRRRLIEALAPTPAAAPAPTPASADGNESPAASEAPPAAEPAPAPAAAAAPATPEPTPEQNALIADLHWLIHQGHVIEFANGTLETAKKPLPRPPKPAKPEPPAEGAPEAAQPAPDTPAEQGIAAEGQPPAAEAQAPSGEGQSPSGEGTTCAPAPESKEPTEPQTSTGAVEESGKATASIPPENVPPSADATPPASAAGELGTPPAEEAPVASPAPPVVS